MTQGDAEWFRWYVDTCWEEEAGGLLADTHALALRKIEREIAMHKRRKTAIRAAAKRRATDEANTCADGRR
jgi:hypothetical protein